MDPENEKQKNKQNTRDDWPHHLYSIPGFF
jgi:hypothetical protein